MSSGKYCYPDSDVLINKYQIHDRKLLEKHLFPQRRKVLPKSNLYSATTRSATSALPKPEEKSWTSPKKRCPA